MGDLVLRVNGGPRNGQIVRLRSAKCTIGSGPYCTLRLRARGVSPLHCLIVRGHGATVVRRWTADTRLNHQAFADAPLSAGDQLSIGPVELEVVSIDAQSTSFTSGESRWHAPMVDSRETTSGSPSETESPLERQRHAEALEAERRRLDELSAILDGRQASLSAEAEKLDSERIDFQTQQRQWQAEQDEAAAKVADRGKQLDALLAETQSVRQTFDLQQRQWQTEQAEARRRLDAWRDELHARQTELEAQEAQRTDAQRRLESLQNELFSRQTELEAQENALAQQQRQWEDRRTEVASEASVSDEQLQARQADLEAEREALAEQRRRWEVERDQAAAQIADREKQLNALDARQTALEDQISVLGARQAALEEQENVLGARQAALEEQKNALDARQVTLEEQEGDLDARQAALKDQEDDLDARQAALNDQENALNARQAALKEQEDDLARQREEWETQRVATVQAAESEADAEPILASPAAEPEFQTPSEKAPINLTDVFRHLGVARESEEEGPTTSVEAASSDESSQKDASSLQAATSTKPVPAAGEKEAEESIDDYMNRLMQRLHLGGKSKPAGYVPSPPQPSVAPPAAPASVVPSPTPAQPTGEMTPRTAAPETHNDLSTFRELANLSAHAAIGRHSRQVLIRTMHSKLFVAIIGLAAGGALFWMWKSFSATQMTLYSALLALMVAVYWGLEYALLTGRLVIHKSGSVDLNWKTWSLRKKPDADVAVAPEAEEDARAVDQDRIA